MHYEREFTGSVQGCGEPALWDTAWVIPVHYAILLSTLESGAQCYFVVCNGAFCNN